MDLKKNFQSKSAVNIFLKEFVNYIKAGHCIFLSGDLGVGKTYFSQQIIKYLTPLDIVTSPTFNLVNTYQYNNKRMCMIIYVFLFIYIYIYIYIYVSMCIRGHPNKFIHE